MFGNLFKRAPSEYAVRIMPADSELRISASETLLQGALKQGIALPHNCRAGGCGECKCRLLEGKVKELTDKSYLLSAEELRENYILACQSMPKSDVVIEVTLRPKPLHPVVESQGTIAALSLLTHDILHVVIDLAGPIAYTPGQYAQLSIPTGSGVISRSYSFASCHAANGETHQVEFFIRKVPGGKFTETLFSQTSVGTTITVQGPYGDFYLRPAPAPILCIAGGSGLAPINALLKHELGSGSKPREVILVFGARTQQDLYWRTGIEQMKRQWPGRFTFVPILSDEPAGSDWAGLRGFIPEHLPNLFDGQLGQSHAYLCGPPPMIDACTATLSEQGLLSTAIYADRFLDQSHLAKAG